MRILLYNWIPFDDKNGRGGGVTVYLKNLIDEIMKKDNCNIEVFFLSSGCYYDIYNEEIRYEETSNIYGKKCRTFSIINSPVFSPGFLSFYYLDKVLYDKTIKDVFNNFLDEYGPFDAVHFHNLEGLSIRLLTCKKNYPNTKFIYTLHNYYPFCPQINLWKEEHCNCNSQNTGEACIKCMDQHVPAEKLRHKMAMTYSLVKNPSEILATAYKYCGSQLDSYYEKIEKSDLSEDDYERLVNVLKQYRKYFVEMINTNIDIVLAVSERVREIAIKMGIKKQLLRVSYIGTKAADFALNHSNCNCSKNAPFSLIYMGYQRIDKGYYFLVEVLNTMPEDIAKKIDVMILAKKHPNSKYKDTMINKDKFHSFVAKDGYLKDEMQTLLMNKHLGIIPVLWEDNLPQVAIEMTAYGVPILTSDLGGASELCGNKAFIFHAGDVNECINKISKFVCHPEILDEYWKDYKGLKTMKTHLKELIGYWS